MTPTESPVKVENWVTKNGKWVVIGTALLVIGVAMVFMYVNRGYKTIEAQITDFEIEETVFIADVNEDTIVVPIEQVRIKKGNAGVSKLNYEVRGEAEADKQYRNLTFYVNKDEEAKVKTAYEYKTGSKLTIK